eukprot:2188352-Rhodomonas_salina.1
MAVHGAGLESAWDLLSASRAESIRDKWQILLSDKIVLGEKDRGSTCFLPTSVLAIRDTEALQHNFNDFMLRLRLHLPHELALHAAVQDVKHGRLDASKRAFRSESYSEGEPLTFVRLPSAMSETASM